MSDATPAALPPGSVIGVFEGGGARGVAHVGAVKAMEELGLPFCALAGTSAGAIIAALTAAGYSADEIFNPAEPRAHIIRRVTGRGPRALFQGWWRLAALRFVAGACGHPVSMVLGGGALTVSLMLAAERGGLGVMAGWDANQWWIALGLLMALVLLGLGLVALLLWPVFWRRGLFPTARIVAALDRMLRAKVVPAQRGPLTFRQMRAAGRPPLAIVATDFDTGAAVVFDAVNHPDVAVAVAVAASVAVPFLLQPVVLPLQGTEMRSRLRRPAGRFMDGGMVSNLPAWLFGALRDAPSQPRTAAFLLADPPAMPRGFWGFCGRTAGIAIFGGQTLSIRQVPRLTAIRLRCAPLRMLDFDMNEYQACRSYGQAKVDAAAGLRRLNGEAEQDVAELLEKMASAEAASGSDKKPQASILVPAGQTELQLRFHHQLRPGAGAGLRLPLHGSIAGACFRAASPMLWRRTDNTLLNLGGATPTSQRLIPEPFLSGVETMFAIPLQRPWRNPAFTAAPSMRTPFAVFCIDFSDDRWEYFQQASTLLAYREIADRLSLQVSPFETWRFDDGFDPDDMA